MSARERLETEYGDQLPAGLAALTDAQQAQLADAIAATRTRQAEALAEATDNGLDFIPRMMRGAVKRVLFG